MPPKKKFNKKQKQSQAQAQMTNVVVKVGDVSRRRRKRAPTKKNTGTASSVLVPVPPTIKDGWLPSAVLNRSGSFFAPPTYNIPYLNQPTYPTAFAPSGQNLMLPRAPAPSVFAASPPPALLEEAPAPERETPQEPPSDDWTDLPMARFIRPTVSGRPFQELKKQEEEASGEYLVSSPPPRSRLFIGTPTETPSFVDVASERPSTRIDPDTRMAIKVKKKENE